jgi:hypothetical protein
MEDEKDDAVVTGLCGGLKGEERMKARESFILPWAENIFWQGESPGGLDSLVQWLAGDDLWGSAGALAYALKRQILCGDITDDNIELMTGP